MSQHAARRAQPYHAPLAGICVLLVSTGAAARQSPPVYCSNPNYLSVSNGNCNPSPWGGFPQPNHPSRCWKQFAGEAAGVCDAAPPMGMPGLGPQQAAFPFNLHLAIGVTPPNFPPRTRDRIRGSSPLISRDVAWYAGPVTPPERPTLQETVDLVTGAPLLQDIDFELAFGGALFRHVRTYSERGRVGGHELPCFDSQLMHASPPDTMVPFTLWNGSQEYWDWHGQGWMMGENPILLIDATYWGTSEFASGTEGRPLDTWCYFVVDSHHSVPFKFDTLNGAYVAPARFGALMSHNGAWNPSTQQWTTAPSEFYVWLDQQTSRYTFKAYREDVPHVSDGLGGWISLHNPPLPNEPVINGLYGRGVGIPYYGLLTRIDDRFGHQVRIHYCGFHQFVCNAPNEPQPGCTGCCQNCHEKGQISRIELISGFQPETATGTIEWTLLFAHRAFKQMGNYLAGPSEYKWHRQQAVHSIHVYKRGLTTAELAVLPSCATIEFAEIETALTTPPWPLEPTRADLISALARVRGIDAATRFGFPGDWLHKAQYLYTDSTKPFDDGWKGPPVGGGSPVLHGDHLFGHDTIGSWTSPRLLLASTTTRTEPAPLKPTTERHRLYKYRVEGYMAEGASRYDNATIKAVYGPETTNAIRNGITDHPDAAALMQNWPLGMLTLLDEEDVNDSADTEHDPALATTRRFVDSADMHFEHWGVVGEDYGAHYGGFYSSPYHRDMVEKFINPPLDRFVALTDGAHFFQDRRGTGSEGRLFKLHRFLLLPTDHAVPGIPPAYGYSFNGSEVGSQRPFRAVWLEPFHYLASENSIEFSDRPNLSQEQWITVIDEFAKVEHCRDPDYTLRVEVTNDPPTLSACLSGGV